MLPMSGLGSGILAGVAASRSNGSRVCRHQSLWRSTRLPTNARANGIRRSCHRGSIGPIVCIGLLGFLKAFDVHHIQSAVPFWRAARHRRPRMGQPGLGDCMVMSLFRTGAQKGSAIGAQCTSFFHRIPTCIFSDMLIAKAVISRADCDGSFDRDRIDDYLRIGPSGVECSNSSEYRSGRQQFRRLPRREMIVSVTAPNTPACRLQSRIRPPSLAAPETVAPVGARLSLGNVGPKLAQGGSLALPCSRQA